jgi:hypothetical protein
MNLEERIEAPFITNCAAEPVADVRAARRAVTMRRVNNYAIGELQVKIAQCVELLFGQLFFLAAAEEVGADEGHGLDRLVTAVAFVATIALILLSPLAS